MLSATAIARFAGSIDTLVLKPGAHAPGFMLPSAPRTKTKSLSANRADTTAQLENFAYGVWSEAASIL